MIVTKFGGTSVGSVENIQRVKQILKQKQEPFVAVFSAFSGVTDQLEQLAVAAKKNEQAELLEQLKDRHYQVVKALFEPRQQSEVLLKLQQHFAALDTLCQGIANLEELSDRTRAKMLSKGELLSSTILFHFLQQDLPEVAFLPSWQHIRANGSILQAHHHAEETREALRQISNLRSYVAPGFVATDHQEEVVLLGRGGSDYTASILADGLNASGLEIWSDVDGMLTADPRMVAKAKRISHLSYAEALEMAFYGAKVLYPPAIAPAMDRQIPIHLKNTLNPDGPGSLIEQDGPDSNKLIKGISSLRNMAMLTISGVGLKGAIGTARRVFQALELAEVNVVLITQGSSEQSIGIGIRLQDSDAAVRALESEFSRELGDGSVQPIEVVGGQIILALVGDNMKHKVGLSGKVFQALGENNINVRAIAQGSSERNISIMLDERDEKKALNVLHEYFFELTLKEINVFVIGVGNVGSRFLELFFQQRAYCREHFQVDLRLAGVANSSRYRFAREGLSLDAAQKVRSEGLPYSQPNELVDQLIQANMRNCMVIDNTASAEIAGLYPDFLGHSISVATCNKIAVSSEFGAYKNLHQLARRQNCHLKYETAVGAALPILKTISDLRLSGDRITRIEAVLSGSLNFIFNHYDGQQPFASIVRRAQDEGYTEPDPRIDLSGLDVMRKLLILAREAGHGAEMDAVHFDSFLPESCFSEDSVDAFYAALESEEEFFQQLYASASNRNCRLKVIARLEDGQLEVGLREVPESSPFYHLGGKDNIVAINTLRYADEPLVIKGAGAGAEITASGVFADLIYIVNN